MNNVEMQQRRLAEVAAVEGLQINKSRIPASTPSPDFLTLPLFGRTSCPDATETLSGWNSLICIDNNDGIVRWMLSFYRLIGSVPHGQPI
jgi:hypothetical protein